MSHQKVLRFVIRESVATVKRLLGFFLVFNFIWSTDRPSWLQIVLCTHCLLEIIHNFTGYAKRLKRFTNGLSVFSFMYALVIADIMVFVPGEVHLSVFAKIYAVVSLLQVFVIIVQQNLALFVVFVSLLHASEAEQQAPVGLDSAMMNVVSSLFSAPAPAAAGGADGGAEGSADGGAQGEPSQCSICLGEYEAGEHVRKFNGCKHQFHAECIETWLARSTQCPLCRDDLVQRGAAAAASPEAASEAATAPKEAHVAPVSNSAPRVTRGKKRRRVSNGRSSAAGPRDAVRQRRISPGAI